jgi:prepilin-type N-terminal cleavage/methylation domain-containing protein
MIRRSKTQAGLTLLEALVAMAIIGSAFGAILELQAQLVRGLDKVTAAHSISAWRLNAVEIASMISREEDRRGTIEWEDGTRLSWQPASGDAWRSPNRIGLRVRGNWTVTLAPIDFTVTRNGRTLLKTQRLAVSAAPAAGPP